MDDRLESTIKDAARLCWVPERTIREWTSQGRLTWRRHRGRILVDLREVTELAAMRRDAGGRLPRMPAQKNPKKDV